MFSFSFLEWDKERGKEGDWGRQVPPETRMGVKPKTKYGWKYLRKAVLLSYLKVLLKKLQFNMVYLYFILWNIIKYQYKGCCIEIQVDIDFILLVFFIDQKIYRV